MQIGNTGPLKRPSSLDQVKQAHQVVQEVAHAVQDVKETFQRPEPAADPLASIARPPGGTGPLGAPPSGGSDADFVTACFHQYLHRDPGPQGLLEQTMAMAGGMGREAIAEAIRNSPEAAEKAATMDHFGPNAKNVVGALPAGTLNPDGSVGGKGYNAGGMGYNGMLLGFQPGPLPPLPGCLDDPSYRNAPVDTSSVEAAVTSAAKWALESSADLVARIEKMEAAGAHKGNIRALQKQITDKVVGALRAHGLDVDFLARHTNNEPGQATRYVTDALVLPDGRAIDWWTGNGGDFHDLDVPLPKTDRNTGVTAQGLPFSSSVTGHEYGRDGVIARL